VKRRIDADPTPLFHPHHTLATVALICANSGSDPMQFRASARVHSLSVVGAACMPAAAHPISTSIWSETPIAVVDAGKPRHTIRYTSPGQTCARPPEDKGGRKVRLQHRV